MLIAALLSPTAVLAQPAYPSSPPASVSLAQVEALIPQPSTATPASEAVSGAVGSGGQYALANHVHPRLTRASSWAVGANGVLSGTWASPLPVAPNMIYTATAASTSRVTCQNTSTPTATGFTAVCWQDTQVALNSTVVLGGVNIGPAYAPAGTVVQVTAVPPTQ